MTPFFINYSFLSSDDLRLNKTLRKRSNNSGNTDLKEAADTPDPDAPSRVVGIGASAGGLEAVSELLKHLPSKTGMAFVFIQHLEPRQTSRLTDILSRITDMPVEVASDRLRRKRNHIYVMPPGVDLTLSDGMLVLERTTESARRPLPFDYVFHSSAQDQGSKAVAVILFGMGHDGSAGLKSVK